MAPSPERLALIVRVDGLWSDTEAELNPIAVLLDSELIPHAYRAGAGAEVCTI